jgi:hypothetical protein
MQSKAEHRSAVVWSVARFPSIIMGVALGLSWVTLGAAASAPISGPTVARSSTTTKDAESTPALRISEVLASNSSAHANSGTFPDVIELYNASPTTVDLSGKRLGDASDPTSYTFPAGTTIAAQSYLLIYADEEDEAAGLHTGFALDSEGDEVWLYDSVASGGALIDSIRFGFQISDLSLSRTAADASVWALTLPTIGAPNGNAVPTGSVNQVVINEWTNDIKVRTDKDFIELYNPSDFPVGLGDARITDDLVANPERYDFRKLSFIPAEGLLLLDTDKLEFQLDEGFAQLFFAGSDGVAIDQITNFEFTEDHSIARVPDGSANWVELSVPTPGISNTSVFPASAQALLDNLRITELMYDPIAPSSARDYEFVELTNIGTANLDLSGLRFTNGIRYTFSDGTTLAPGAQIVVARTRPVFLSRFPQAAGVLAIGEYDGALDNSGETIALTVPSPWDVHVLKFRYEPDWYPPATGQGYSLVMPEPMNSPARDWDESRTWGLSAEIGGNPGGFTADAGGEAPGDADARLLNLSTRGRSLTGADALVPGFVLGGSGTKELLIRAVGPTLTDFGVPDVHADPSLTLKRFDSATGSFVDVLSNDNWSDNANADMIASVGATLGAFALEQGSADAAILTRLGPGSYTVVTGSPQGDTGTAIVELYDADASSPPLRLLNISTRGFIASGESPLISGFVISEEGPRTVLVRAVGPTLGDYGVTGVMADPQLTLFRDGTALFANNDWSEGASASNIESVGQTVGAFALPLGSSDAALLVTLAPGIYTAQADSADGGDGVTLVEIYLVP